MNLAIKLRLCRSGKKAALGRQRPESQRFVTRRSLSALNSLLVPRSDIHGLPRNRDGIQRCPIGDKFEDGDSGAPVGCQALTVCGW